ncbi:MAG: ATP-dependent DNA helicase RecG, partial [Pseudomonadota bacterium]
MGRPERLFSLFAEIDGIKGVGPRSIRAFARLRVETRRDLLFHMPTGVIDRRPSTSLAGVLPGGIVTVEGHATGHQAPRRPGAPHRVTFAAAGTVLEFVFFRAKGDWLQRQLPMGQTRLVSGKAELYDDRWQILHPDFIVTPEEAAEIPPFEPIYPLAEGLTQRLVGKAVREALTDAPILPEWHDPALMTREHWPAWRDALQAIHMPEGPGAHGPGAPARQRLAYDELLSHQLALALGRAQMRRGQGQVTV